MKTGVTMNKKKKDIRSVERQKLADLLKWAERDDSDELPLADSNKDSTRSTDPNQDNDSRGTSNPDP